MGDAIETLRDRYYQENHTGPLYHALSRPAHLEAAAVKRAIELATVAGCPLYIVHVSAGESLQHIRKARAKGQTVYGETCPQYLLQNDSKYTGTFKETSPYVISPPLRAPEDSNALWEALADGTLSTVGTDHCPYTMDQKKAGINDFRKIPGGAGGVEHRLALLYNYGLLTNRLNFNQIVNLFSSAPSGIFGILPCKGILAEGADADIVIWNPEPESVISAKNHHMNCDVNIYEGMQVKGRAEYVIKAGKVVIENGSLVPGASRGQFLFRTI